MGFISNKERQKTAKKLYSGFGGKKWVIFTAIVLGLLCSVYILIGILNACALIKANEVAFTNSNHELTTFGIVALVIIGFTLVFGVIAIILTLTLKSPKSVTKDVIKLTSSAIPGRRNSKSAAKTAKERF